MHKVAALHLVKVKPGITVRALYKLNRARLHYGVAVIAQLLYERFARIHQPVARNHPSINKFDDIVHVHDIAQQRLGLLAHMAARTFIRIALSEAWRSHASSSGIHSSRVYPA